MANRWPRRTPLTCSTVTCRAQHAKTARRLYPFTGRTFQSYEFSSLDIEELLAVNASSLAVIRATAVHSGRQDIPRASGGLGHPMLAEHKPRSSQPDPQTLQSDLGRAVEQLTRSGTSGRTAQQITNW
jgi:hypothetical protein